MQVGSVCECGSNRKYNQDALYAFPNASDQTNFSGNFSCLIVCNGMGDQSPSPVFPQVIEVIRKHIAETIQQTLIQDDYVPPADQVLGEIKTAFLKANQLLLDQVELEKRGAAAGVTATVRMKGQLYVGHIGHTRAYKITEGRIQQLTQDHSYWDRLISASTLTPFEREEPPYRHILYRALGGNESIEVDTLIHPISKGGWLLLCTDGLHNYVTEYLMVNTILNHPPQEAADRLMALALEHGSEDNISVIVARL